MILEGSLVVPLSTAKFKLYLYIIYQYVTVQLMTVDKAEVLNL